ncbi:MAG: DNA polymerase sliding clamp [Desulfurococcaceae archaeon]|nr:DNA polymerase sliding clamp [Desulfurococcaceae archaeon]
MSFTAPDARVWSYVIEATGKFSESGVFVLKPDSLYVRAIDPSRTAMIEFYIPKEAFESYEPVAEKTVYLSMEDLSKILKSAGRSDKLTMSFSEDSIRIEFSDGVVTRMFKIPLRLEIAHEEIPSLEIEYPNKYVVSGDVLHEALASIEKVGDVLKVSGDESTLKLESVGDLGEAEVILSLERGVLREADVKNPGFEVSYSIDYLSYMKKPIKSSDEVVVMVGSDLPICLELRFPSGSKLSYYVAPRTE